MDSSVIINSNGLPAMKMELNLSPTSSDSYNMGTPTSTRILLDVPCKVCSDHSSGKHYGIFACDGCAGFFKRSIRRNRQYVCKNRTNNCPVDKTHRNQCRACRLTRCMEVGMNKDAVQHERGPRNSTIRRQVALYLKDAASSFSPSSGTGASAAPAQPPLLAQLTSNLRGASFEQQPPLFPVPAPTSMFPAFAHTGGLLTPAATPTAPSFPALAASLPALLAFPPQHAAPLDLPALAAAFSQNSALAQLSALLATYGPLASSLATAGLPLSQLFNSLNNNEAGARQTKADLCDPGDSASQLLGSCLKWAKSVPAFAALPHADQALLVKRNWKELFLLSLAHAQKSVDPEETLLSLGVDRSADPAKFDSLLNELRTLKDLLNKFKTMQVDPTEFACLKGIVLFDVVSIKQSTATSGDKSPRSASGNGAKTSDTLGCETQTDRSTIVALQDQAQLTLNRYVQSTYPNQQFRFGKLLLMLPDLEKISAPMLMDVFWKQPKSALFLSTSSLKLSHDAADAAEDLSLKAVKNSSAFASPRLDSFENSLLAAFRAADC